jgi:hypothetical protein
MGLFGIIIASLANIFLGSNQLQWIISVIAVIVFVGLTAWDTQKIKEMYDPMDDGTVGGRKAVMGAPSTWTSSTCSCRCCVCSAIGGLRRASPFSNRISRIRLSRLQGLRIDGMPRGRFDQARADCWTRFRGTASVSRLGFIRGWAYSRQNLLACITGRACGQATAAWRRPRRKPVCRPRAPSRNLNSLIARFRNVGDGDRQAHC